MGLSLSCIGRILGYICPIKEHKLNAITGTYCTDSARIPVTGEKEQLIEEGISVGFGSIYFWTYESSPITKSNRWAFNGGFSDNTAMRINFKTIYRKSLNGFVLAAKCPQPFFARYKQASLNTFGKLPQATMHTVTLGGGTVLFGYGEIEEALGVK